MKYYFIIVAGLLALLMIRLNEGAQSAVPAPSPTPLPAVGAPAMTPEPLAPIPALVQKVQQFFTRSTQYSDDDVKRSFQSGAVCPQLRTPPGALKIASITQEWPEQLSDPNIREEVLVTQKYSGTKEQIFYVTFVATSGNVPTFGPAHLTAAQKKGWLILGADSGSCYKNGTFGT
jgi:hypothetical protein